MCIRDRSYYNKEVADAGDDGKVAAVGVLQDFQFAFSGLMGGQGVNRSEKSVHEGSAGEEEGDHYTDYGTCLLYTSVFAFVDIFIFSYFRKRQEMRADEINRLLNKKDRCV